jgi:hypothetical protein
MAKSTLPKEIKTFDDAWRRFEHAVDVVAKSPPQHRTKGGKPKKRSFRQRRAKPKSASPRA